MNTPIGIAILTNGDRLEYLKRCINSFLDNCHYRPLVISVFNNGSTKPTQDWLDNHPDIYGVDWRIDHSEIDLGCARGTNASISLVKEMEFVIHLESDFEHLPAHLSKEDKMWLHRAVRFMQSSPCDYLYLRRMVNERDIYQHWWSQWMSKIDRVSEDGRYLHCPSFWWSNNSTLFRPKVLYKCGTLPLDESKDGPKGSSGWSRPELEAARPLNTWIHKWGLFVHELPLQPNILLTPDISQCWDVISQGDCKYGFFKSNDEQISRNSFCTYCDRSKGFEDMENHAKRFMPGS